MSITITREQAEDIAANLDADLREDYSGRGMYGATCIGFTGSFSEVTLGYYIGEVSVENGFDGYEIAQKARSDSMGLDIIVYFPGVTIEEDN